MRNKYFLTVMYFFKYLRIKDWFYIVGLSYLGFFCGVRQFRIQDLLYLSVIASLYLAHGYSINNYFDMRYTKADSTAVNYTHLNSGLSLIISTSLYIINLVISFYYSRTIFILVVLGGIVSFLYSSSLAHFKGRTLFNIILNSTGFTIIFLLGYLMNKRLDARALCLVGYIWLGIISSQIIHLLAHRDIEQNWKFTPRHSFVLFYLSLLIWLVWTFIFFHEGKAKQLIFLSTLALCIVEIVIIEDMQCRNKFSIDKIMKVRNIFKFANIILGLFLAFLFIFL